MNQRARLCPYCAGPLPNTSKPSTTCSYCGSTIDTHLPLITRIEQHNARQAAVKPKLAVFLDAMTAALSNSDFTQALYFAESYHFTLGTLMFDAEHAQDLEAYAMQSVRALAESWNVPDYKSPSERGTEITWETLGERLREATELQTA